MNFKQLEYFVDLAQTLSYTETARRLFVSQTAITKQIQNLENKLGVRLFDRDKRRVSLTSAGEVFLEDAADIVRRVRDTRLHLEAHHRGERGMLKVGFLKEFDFAMLQAIVSGFHKRYPDVRLEFGGYMRKKLENLLQSGELDIILSIDANDTPAFRKTLGRSFPLVAAVAANHRLASKRSVSASDLKNLVYDVRKDHDGRRNVELEGALLQVSCSLGEAIVHEFVIQPSMRPYVSVISLLHRESSRRKCMIKAKVGGNRLHFARSLGGRTAKREYQGRNAGAGSRACSVNAAAHPVAFSPRCLLRALRFYCWAQGDFFFLTVD